MAPTLAPFNFHWYDGVPPFVGVAVNVTDVPAQIVDVPEIATEGVMVGLTVIVTVFEVAVAGLEHDKPEVITQFTVFPFAKVLLE